MNRIARWRHLLPAACLALCAAAPTALAQPGTGLVRNETYTQIEKRFLEKQKVCEALRDERCLADAKAERESARAAADAGHSGVVARREARDAEPHADKRASLHQAGEEELEVQRRLALARCDEEPRDKRDSCRDVARARYGK